MKTNKTFIYLMLILLFNSSVTFGQKVINNYIDNRPVVLQIDRDYYLPGEPVYFKAYLKNASENNTSKLSDTLNISVLDQDGLMVASGEFKADNSQISGKVELPDFISEGDYIVVASDFRKWGYSDDNAYSRMIEIRKPAEPNLITELSLTDTIYDSHKELTASVNFTDKAKKPVSVGFSYRIEGTSGKIADGKSKSDGNGNARVIIQLPEIKDKESLRLFVDPNFKGSKTVTCVVIPTKYNYSERQHTKQINQTAQELNQLNIKAIPTVISTGEDGKIKLDFSISDDKGNPVMANLAVSSFNSLPSPLSGNKYYCNYHETDKVNNNSKQEFFENIAKSYRQLIQSPGSAFILQEKNDAKKLHKKFEADQKNTAGYNPELSVLDILMQVKPYRIVNNKITFGISTMTSLNSLDGALIVVDGVKQGTDASILNNYPVADIAKITASTNALDIQKYSALNNNGVIEITMKKSKEYLKHQEEIARTKSNTLYWEPDLITDKSGNVSVEFPNNNRSGEILITFKGLSSSGLTGSGTVVFPVK